jgi:hypothetical protein
MKMESKAPIITIIPAAPGWAAVGPVMDGDRVVDLWEEPIVAWRVETELTFDEKNIYDTVTPIAAECFDIENALLRRPDGRLYAPADRDFENDEQAIAYLQAREDAERLRRSRKKA